MRRPVIAMCAALAALAVPVSTGASATATTSSTTTSADHHHPRQVTSAGDSQTATRSAARIAARSAARTKAAKAHRSRAAADATPLSVTIDQLTPSTIPASGVIHVAGTVTNNDTATWTLINVYAFISAAPMTSADQLAAAAKTDPSAFVGNRICADGSCTHYDTIPSLAPGEQATFSFTVPRKLLHASQAGVYWFGVHALGQGPDGRDSLADGRARTFLPLIPQNQSNALPTALVIPLRRPLSYADDGSLMDLAGWLQNLQPGGRLDSLVEFGAAAGDRTVDWEIDPALVDAVRRLAAGNPGRSLAANLTSGQADQEPDGTGSATPSPSGSTTTTAATTAADEATTQAPKSPVDLASLDPVTKEVATAAQAFLDRLSSAIHPQDQVLALPYGDTDVSAAARYDTKLYQRARARSDAGPILPGVTATPAVGSPSGYLSPAALDLITPGTTVLMTDKMFTDPPPTVADVDGLPVVVTSTGGAAGGPGPDDPTSVTAMRQRLLAEAAVRLLRPDPAPLVVMLPHDWNPSSTSPTTFFLGLDVPWLNLTTVESAADLGTPRPVASTELHYPKWQASDELDAANFASADQLMAAGDSLQSLLTLNNVVSGTVSDEAFGTTSYSARTHPDASRADADRSRDWIDARLSEVTVSGPQSVTLSSSTGKFSATVVNGLGQPVSVSLRARGNRGLRIDPPQRLDLPANGRASVLLNTHAGENGLHQVTLMVTDKRGVPLGATTQVSIRSAQVSNLIWLIMAIGVGLLLGTIGLRLLSRIRAARRNPPPDGGSAAGDPPADDAGTATMEPAGAGTR